MPNPSTSGSTRKPGLLSRAVKAAREALNKRKSEPFDGASQGFEIHLEECMDGADHDESMLFADVTQRTLDDMRQEISHSLDRDPADAFFWRKAGPDAVAGMAKVYLCARCPTPYWRSLVASNSYALWGAIILARAQARSVSAACSPIHLEASCLLGIHQQASLLLSHAPRGRDMGERFDKELMRAEGLALPWNHLGDIHKHSALRALFAAVLLDKPIDWPDLPPRLGKDDPVPEKLPGLLIDLETLGAKVKEVDRSEAEGTWLDAYHAQSSQLLLVPDWASWMLDGNPAGPFAKLPTRP